MQFDLHEAKDILARTPRVLFAQLKGIPDEWVMTRSEENTWSVFDIVGHLIVGEKTDWMIRAQIIEEQGSNTTFLPFDREAQFEYSKDKSMIDLLHAFELLREHNLDKLHKMTLDESDFELTGIHPELGLVTMKQLLATWVVHDLSHLAQISKVMAKHYKDEVGPWQAYIPILKR